MLKSSLWIKEQAENNQIIDPFIPNSIREGVISYGLGPYGYDIRLDKTYKYIKKSAQMIDPFNLKEEHYETKIEDKILMSPYSYILGKSLEYFRIPKKVLGIVFGKSTYARSGVLVNVTPLEPEWSGYLTISISNVSGRSVVLYPMQGIAQVIFFESNELPAFSYKDLNGKYNEQKEITISKIDKY